MNRQRKIHKRKDERRQGNTTRYLSSTNTMKRKHQTKSTKELILEKRALTLQTDNFLNVILLTFTEIRKVTPSIKINTTSNLGITNDSQNLKHTEMYGINSRMDTTKLGRGGRISEESQRTLPE